jgi:putative membrane protein
MKTFVFIAGGIGSLALTASVALAAPKAEDFLKMGIQGDNTEIAMGQMAQQKGSTQELRSYGQTLVDDHTTAKQQKMDVAKQLNVSPSDALKPEAAALQSKLNGLSGLDFDRAFVAAMIDDHQKDIADFQEEAQDNNGPASTLAGKQLPVLQKHLKMAEDIKNSESGAAAGKQATASEGFLAQESEGLWRGSKFMGVNIYGPDNKKVGDVNDVLVDQTGKITHIVVGVGGFLGIGEKNVAIPFDKMNFAQTPMASQTQTGGAAQQNSAPANAGIAPATNAGLGTPPAASDAGGMAGGTTATNGTAANGTGANGGMATAAMQPRSMAYPDHGTIDYTADQLKSAPTFNYAK